MKINGVNSVDFDDSTVAVTATAKGTKNTFYVQTVDGEYRPDLHCWITIEDGDGHDIDSDHFPDFDINDIVLAAEDFLSKNVEVEETKFEIDKNTVYLIHSKDSVKIATRNTEFINSETSSYQREFDPIAEFDNKDEAIEHLENLQLINDDELERE